VGDQAKSGTSAPPKARKTHTEPLSGRDLTRHTPGFFSPGLYISVVVENKSVEPPVIGK